MWRSVNIVIGILLLATTVATSIYGVSIEPDSAERLLNLEMRILGWGFVVQIATMVALVLVTSPWDLDAAKAEQRALKTTSDDFRWVIRRFREAAALRHEPGLKNKATAILMTSFLWVFVASVLGLASMFPIVATCGC